MRWRRRPSRPPAPAPLATATMPHKEVDASAQVAKDSTKPDNDQPGRASGEKE